MSHVHPALTVIVQLLPIPVGLSDERDPILKHQRQLQGHKANNPEYCPDPGRSLAVNPFCSVIISGSLHFNTRTLCPGFLISKIRQSGSLNVTLMPSSRLAGCSICRTKRSASCEPASLPEPLSADDVFSLFPDML